MPGKLLKWLVHIIGNCARNFRINYLRAAGVNIGENCMLSMRAKIDIRRGKIIIGNNCTITYGCIVLAHDRSEMHIHPERSGEYTTRIGDNVFLGVGSIILPGITIGANSVVGAGAVVTRNLPEGAVAIGNPAKIIKEINAT